MTKKHRRNLHLDRRAERIALEVADQDQDQLLRTREVAAWFGTSIAFLELGRMTGYGPPFVKLATQMVRYKRSACVKWLKERQRLTTAG